MSNELYIPGSRWDGSRELRGKWIRPRSCPTQRSVVMAFRLEFDSHEERILPVCLSADQRFRLFANGQLLSDGPERGDLNHWYYNEVAVPIRKGLNTLVALVWWVSPDDFPSYAQMTLCPAFWIISRNAGESHLIDAGKAPWKSRLLGGYTFLDPEMCWGPGSKIRVDARVDHPGIERGAGSEWSDVEILNDIVADHQANNYDRLRLLHPPMLPLMKRNLIRRGNVKSCQSLESPDSRTIPIDTGDPVSVASARHIFETSPDGHTFPPHGCWRLIVDLEDYLCAFPIIHVSHGRDARIRLSWAESLFREPRDEAHLKAHRSDWKGLYFVGTGDEFVCDGSPNRSLTTLWWECGRWLELTVETQSEPLTLHSIQLEQTGYPHEYDFEWDCEDQRLTKFVKQALRTLENCQHETFFDCPYYEQLMYFYDSRLQMLCTYVTGRDDRLVIKAIEMFKASQRTCGSLGGSRHPSRVLQLIPTLSPVIIEMLHEYMMWRNNPDFVRKHLGTIRALIDDLVKETDDEGLIRVNRGWAFVDWVEAWTNGVPPGVENDVSGIFNWYVILALEKAACIEDAVGDSELAFRNRRLALRLADITKKTFWCESRGLFADDRNHTSFSQHAQCYALLSGQLAGPELTPLASRMMEDPSLHSASLSFRHNLFEALALTGRTDLMRTMMEEWWGFEATGFKTLPEKSPPTRSDCHAWSAHPLYHLFATFCGIRPGSPFFKSIHVSPQTCLFGQMNIRIPHPGGSIHFKWLPDGRWIVDAPPGIGMIHGPEQGLQPDRRNDVQKV